MQAHKDGLDSCLRLWLLSKHMCHMLGHMPSWAPLLGQYWRPLHFQKQWLPYPWQWITGEAETWKHPSLCFLAAQQWQGKSRSWLFKRSSDGYFLQPKKTETTKGSRRNKDQPSSLEKAHTKWNWPKGHCPNLIICLETVQCTPGFQLLWMLPAVVCCWCSCDWAISALIHDS